MRLDVNLLLEKLSKIRPLFHTEADFQFYFAWSPTEEYFKNCDLEPFSSRV